MPSNSIATNHFSNSAVNESWMIFHWSSTTHKDGNYSDVSWWLEFKRYSSNWVVVNNITVWIDGSRGNTVGNGKYQNGNSLGSGSFRVNHNNNGDGGFTFNCSANVYYNSGNGGMSIGNTWQGLEHIPRYLTSYDNWVNSTGLTSANIGWSCSPNSDHVQRSLNGGGWTNTDTAAGTSGSYTISGLSANTGYNVRTRLKRADSQLWSETGYCYPTTKDKSRITDWWQNTLPAPGNSMTMHYKCNNPSGSYTTAYLERNGGGIGMYNSKQEGLTGHNWHDLPINASAVNKIYSQHANVTSAYAGDSSLRECSGMQITAQVGSYYDVRNVRLLMSKANCGPTGIAHFTAQEQNSDVAALTGCATNKAYSSSSLSGLRVLKGYSKILVKVPAYPLTVRASASNKSISIGGRSYKNSTSATSETFSNLTTNHFTIKALDSRDFDYSRSADATLVSYSPVRITGIKMERDTGLTENGYLTLSGTYDTVNFGAVTNSVSQIRLLVKKKNVSWGAATINGAASGVIDTGKVNVYDITSAITRGGGKFSCSNKKMLVSGSSGNAIKFITDTEYDCRILVNDQLTAKSSYRNQVVSYDTSLSSGKLIYSAVKGLGICFGSFYDTSIGGTVQVTGNIYQNGKNLKGRIDTPIFVEGDSNTYYPVLINLKGEWGDSPFMYHKFDISRGYAETAPNSWHTDTHRGGLTLSFLWSADGSWGGNYHTIKVLGFSETYSTMVGGMWLTTSGLVVFLRGGGAIYHITSDAGTATRAVIHLNGFTASNGDKVNPRNSSQITHQMTDWNIYKEYATGVTDYGDTNHQIKIGWHTAGLSSCTHLAAYKDLGGGVMGIKDIRICNAVYPVGSIYMSTSSTSPASLFGGTWARIQGRFLIGTGLNEANNVSVWGEYPANSLNMPVNERGGEYRHKLTISEMPSHYHDTESNWDTWPKDWGAWHPWIDWRQQGETTRRNPVGTESAGGDQPHNQLPPYYAVYMWKRTE